MHWATLVYGMYAIWNMLMMLYTVLNAVSNKPVETLMTENYVFCLIVPCTSE